jgi:hypothetical protein
VTPWPSAALACGVLVLVLSPAATGPAAGQRTLTRHFTPRDQQVGRYQYVPFDVPPGTTRIVLSYDYDRDDGANVVDLGVFEPGPLELASKSFRGWSGGARTSVTIGVDEATPGYWPGPIPDGRWHVMLGLYKVGRTGVDVSMTIDTSREPAASARPSLAARPSAPVRRGAAWYVGALHAHTLHSDGALTVQQLADKARAEKLDFLAITDHNNTAHQMEPVEAPDLLLIAGEEVTTPGGHFNVWGLEGLRSDVDFRVSAGDPGVRRLVADARRRGALVSINHPFDTCLACSWTQDVPEGVTAMEISQERPEGRLQALAMWDVLLRQGRRVTAVGTSDWHRGTTPLGVPSVRVRASELSVPAILEAIRAGRVVVLASASLPAPDVTVRAGRLAATIGDEVRVAAGEPLQVEIRCAPAYRDARVDLFWNGEAIATGAVPADGALTFERYATTRGYLRVHVVSPDGTPLAVTNPTFVEIAEP